MVNARKLIQPSGGKIMAAIVVALVNVVLVGMGTAQALCQGCTGPNKIL